MSRSAPGSTAPAAALPGTVRQPRRIWSRLPLAIVWACALLPVALYLLQRQDPMLAVRVVIVLKTWTLRITLATGALAMLLLLAFPPFPAWIRRLVERTRTSWSIDRAPLLLAIEELRHFETAQRHFEVARLAWLRGDLGLCGPHAGRALELEPTMASAHHLFGQYLFRIGALPQAFAAFATAEELDRGHAFGSALLHAARVADLLGNHARALELFLQHERQHGSSPRSAYWRGEALLAAGHKDEARRAYANAAAEPAQKLTAEENWFRALARVKLWRTGAPERSEP